LNHFSIPADYSFRPYKRERMVRRIDRLVDETLVLYAQEGKREALDRLASRWRPRHYAHARRILGTGDNAADAVQDAWISIIRGLWRLKDPTRFPAWSYAIVTRRCQDVLRRTARAQETLLDENLESDPPSDPLGAHDLRDALNSLPPSQRAAIALFYRDGLTVSEIAEALAIPVGTVKTRLFHARRTLRHYLEETKHEQAGERYSGCADQRGR
jgi:RNA polymerase sigma factor (sigma-70 family)